MAINASWQEQIESQQAEHNRLAEQNKSLMEQISQYQASHKDSVNRAKELSDSLKEAFARRDDLQRQIKDIRGNLEVAVAQRDRLKSDLDSNSRRGNHNTAAMKDKDDKIFRLSRELTSWQSRVPPLVEKYQERDQRVRELEAELADARQCIAMLETAEESEETRIEPLNKATLPDGLNASNEQYAATAAHDVGTLQDQFQAPETVDTADVDASVFDENNAADNLADGLADIIADQQFDDELVAGESNGIDHFANEARDDLKAIKGVGPAIEKTLNDLGIYRFNQIAEMSEYDIDRVAEQLKGFRSRIYREDWIGQARDLHYRKGHDVS